MLDHSPQRCVVFSIARDDQKSRPAILCLAYSFNNEICMKNASIMHCLLIVSRQFRRLCVLCRTKSDTNVLGPAPMCRLSGPFWPNMAQGWQRNGTGMAPEQSSCSKGRGRGLRLTFSHFSVSSA